jgi:hypothetical protein
VTTERRSRRRHGNAERRPTASDCENPGDLGPLALVDRWKVRWRFAIGPDFS